MATARSLFRPVGLREMGRIIEADATGFPPRRPEQPIFYPVLNFEYAEQIASRWNTKDPNSGFVGFVTQFHVDADYVARFEERVVGARIHRELWVPAEELDEFNRHIVGMIALVAAHYGEGYKGPIPAEGVLAGRDADGQLVALEQVRGTSGTSCRDAILTNRLAVQLNFAYWVRRDFGQRGMPPQRKAELLRAILQVWREAHPDVQLVGGDEIGA
jgi:hypothetical protein